MRVFPKEAPPGVWRLPAGRFYGMQVYRTPRPHDGQAVLVVMVGDVEARAEPAGAVEVGFWVRPF